MTTIAPTRQILDEYALLQHGLLEFIPGDRKHDGMCTQCSTEMCIAAVERRPPSPAKMLGYAEDMYKRGWCAENGAATVANMAHYIRYVLGKQIEIEWDYAEPFAHDWLGALRLYAGKFPILLQLSAARYLIDAETGSRPEAAARGLACHAIAILGKQTNGYIVGDPDNLETVRRLQIYTRQTLEAAAPCGLLILSMPPAPAPAPKPAPPPVVHTPPPDPAAPLRAVLQQIEALAGAALRG